MQMTNACAHAMGMENGKRKVCSHRRAFDRFPQPAKEQQ